MFIRDDNNELVDSECSLDQFEGAPCVVVESSGGASPRRGIARRNPDYNQLLGLLFQRLAKTGTQITRVILDSRRVSELPVDERVVEVATPYPVDLNSVDIDGFRRMIQREVARMHREPGAGQGGNHQKKIRLCLSKPIDVDSLITKDSSCADLSGETLGPGLTETQRRYLTAARIGQGQFRKSLIARYAGACPVTGIQHELILVASHIKPWKVCTNAERLDPKNGILLSALADRLFDKGLITFSADGFVVVSPRLSSSDREKCGVDDWHRLRLDVESSRFLEYHRTVEFKRR